MPAYFQLVVIVVVIAGASVVVLTAPMRRRAKLTRTDTATFHPVSTLPSATPTILITIFFGVFGLIPAAVQSSNAGREGVNSNKYWKAFGITFVCVLLAYAVLVAILFNAAA
jgi:hypothetical protein